MDINKVMLIWRITTDLEIKKMWDSWISVLNFSLATNRVYKNSAWDKVEEAEFHRCVVFGNLADVVAQYLTKWSKVYAEWRLRTRQWEDQSWNKRYTTEIVVSAMDFLDSKRSSWSNTSNEDVSNPSNDTEDEIPF